MAARLSDSSHILIAWPLWASSYTLQATDGLQAPAWQAVTNRPMPLSNRLAISLPLAATPQFYRLISQ